MKMMRTNFGTVNLMTLALLVLLGGGVARAEDNTSITISGTVSDNGGRPFSVGTNGSYNTLTISNGGMLTNVGVTLIGLNAIANSNTVTVTGSGSTLQTSSGIYVGNDGYGNILTIANSGQVVAVAGYMDGYIGYLGTNNSVTVTGPGSVWNNNWGNNGGFLSIGFEGSGNTLTISNGGKVFDGSGSIGNYAGANSNTVIVTGTNSAWYNTHGDLYVGNKGSSNTLTIANGGVVTNSTGFIGDFGTNNSVLVTGAGSVWSNGTALYVGGVDGAGAFNTLTISNGGTVFGDGYIGASTGANSNTVTVTGTNSAWYGGISVGVYGSGNTLTIANGGKVFGAGDIGGANNNAVLVTGAGSVWSNDSTLCVGSSGSGNSLTISNGGKVFSNGGTIGYNSGANSNTVTGTNSAWYNNGNLYVGYHGSSNSLTIANGGVVTNSKGYIGFFGTNNSVLVTGAGSVWSNGGWLIIGGDLLSVGTAGAFNSLIISNGGTVFGDGYIGASTGANSNTVTVTGTNSAWYGGLSVGGQGSFNTLTIANGGKVFGDGDIGNSGTNNSVLVTGAGSVWSNTSLTVGAGGAFSTLTISNGGKVVSVSGGYIGYNAGANSNTVTVTGTNSAWYNNGDLYVGYSGSSNTLTIANGGVVTNSFGYIGYSGTNNSVLVTGPGSVWSNGSSLYVGAGGAFNTLTITNGGTVVDGFGAIGDSIGANSNTVTVTGTNSAWYNIGSSLYVGFNGSSNTLTIANGGVVTNSWGFIGYSGTNNSVLVTGAGSVWSNGSWLEVGDSGAFNTLTISNGGKVFNGVFGDIGASTGANSNTVIVTGSNSAWYSGDLYVGYHGSSNTLTIANGGVVTNNTGYIGYYGTNNSVLVTGAGSVWSNGYSLCVGGNWGDSSSAGAGNSLTISNRGWVFSGIIGGFIGFNPGANSNTVTVTGTGSAWINNGYDLYVGYQGSSNTLTIANGGTVFSGISGCIGWIGYTNGANNNAVLVTGTGSAWINNGDLYVGYKGSGNTLTITNGGTVYSSIGGCNGGTIGSNAGANSNSVVIAGNNATWDLGSFSLTIGTTGNTGNCLTVASGGILTNATSVTLGGVGSVFTLNGNAFVDTVTVGASATLGGSGRLAGTVNNALGGVIAPGNGAVIGTLTMNSLVMASGSVYNISFNFAGGQTNSQINVLNSGGLTINGGGFNLLTTNGVAMGTAGTYTLLTYAGAIQGLGPNALSILNPVSGDSYGFGQTSSNIFVTVGGAGLSPWTGGAGSDASWTNAANWGGTAPQPNALLTFAGATGANNTNNFVNNTRFNGMLFTNGAGAFILNGNTVNLMGDVINASASNQTINLGLVLDSGSRSFNASNGNITVNGAISETNGAQALVKSGAYTVMLTGTNTYSGATVVNAGTLLITGSVTNSSAGYVANGASLTVNGGQLAFSSVFTNLGTTTLINERGTFTGNAYFGGLSVIDPSTNTFLGNLEVAGTMLLTNSVNVIASNLLVDAGATYSMSQTSATYAVGVFTNQGTLKILSGSVLTNGTAVLDNASTSLVSGTGSVWSNLNLTVGNTGTLSSVIVSNGGALSTANAYIGYNTGASNNAVTVTGAGSVWNNSGALFVGQNGGNNRLTVNAGGTVNAGYLTVNNGTLHIDPLATVNITGNYTQTVNGVLELGIGGATPGSYAQLLVGGTASITGTVRLVQFSGYVPSVGQTQQLVHATVAVSGQFGTVDNRVSILWSALVFNSGSQDVDVTWKPLSVTPTPNQRALAMNIDGAINDPRMATLVNYLFNLPTTQLPAALDMLTPAALASMHDVGFAGLNARGYSFLDRVNELRSGSHGFSSSRLSLYDPSGPGQSIQPIPLTADAGQIYAMRAEDPLNPTLDNPWGVYVAGQGEFTDVHGDANASGYHLASGGLTLGVDRRLGQELVVGCTVGYNDMNGSLANGGQLSVDNGQASLYATWFKDGFHLEGMLGGGYNSYQTSRMVFGLPATGHTDGTEFTSLIGVGYDWQEKGHWSFGNVEPTRDTHNGYNWQEGHWSFGPQLSLQYQRLGIDAFSETGGLAPLHIDAQSYESLQSRVGGRLGWHKQLEHGVIIAPELSAAWQHEYFNSGADLTSQFANGAGTAFTTAGPTLGRNSLVTGLGVSVQWTPTVGTFLNCTTEFGSGYEQQTVNAGVGFRF